MAEGGEVSCSSGSELPVDFFCELCIDDNKQVEAEGYCVDCREYLCGLCYRGHRKSRPTRDHVLQDRSNMPTDTPLSTDRVSKYVTTKCKVHSDKPVDYYCKVHNVLGCANCFATDHRQCAEFEAVAQTSDNLLESQWYKAFISNLHLTKENVRDIEASARENKMFLKRCFKDVVSMVRKLKEDAIVMLNEFEENTVTLAEKIMSEDEDNIESIVKGCTVISQKIENLLSEFESLQTSKRLCQLYINMREAEGEVKTLSESLGKLEEANVVRTFTFQPNAELVPLLNNPDILGTLSYQYQQIRPPSPVTTREHTSIKAKTMDSIHVKSSSDKHDCFITGSAVVSNNRLIIIDANNNKVKLVDTKTNKLLSELKLLSQPFDITVFNKTQAAVTLPCSKIILMMKVSPSLTQEREIYVGDACRGIAYSKDRLLVTFCIDPRLEIMDLRGKVIRTIENDSDGRKLFACPGYVCVSKDEERVYISDRYRGTVTSLTISCDGVVKAVYKDHELCSPGKVCPNHNGTVYVCGIRSKNVHIITVDCKKDTVVLTQADGLDSNVWSVSHCQETNRLFIGMAGDVVKLIQLS